VRLDFDAGDPQTGPAVVLLHGLSDSRESYEPVVAHLRDRGTRVLNVDLRGHGWSPHADRYRAVDYAADVAELIAAEQAGPAIVVGHSLGGLTGSALATLASEAVAALFLEDPPLYEGDDEIRAASPAASFFPTFVAQARAWQAEGASEADVAEALGQAPSAYGVTMLERMGADRVAARARSVLAFDPATMEAAIAGDVWEGYDPSAPMPCPVTVLRADPAVGAVFLPQHAEWYMQAVPHARIEVAPGLAHAIHSDPVGLTPYLAALDEFLERLG
jgi:pimeloyl-ACP methyl ester carboxylesterase